MLGLSLSGGSNHPSYISRVMSYIRPGGSRRPRRHDVLELS